MVSNKKNIDECKSGLGKLIKVRWRNSMMENNIFIGILCIMGGLFGLMMTFYLALCFVCWSSELIEKIIDRRKNDSSRNNK